MEPVTKDDIDRLPRFEKLILQFLATLPRVTLVFERLGEDGKTVFLMPVREGHATPREWLDLESLPRLDLTAAGIDWDRTESTIRQHVGELLKDRFFTISPHGEEIFDMLTYLMWRMDGIMLLARFNIIALHSDRPITRPISFKPERSLIEAYAEMPRASLTIETVGDPIVGLDLSRPFSGWRGDIMHMLFPGGSPEAEALECAACCYYNLGELIHLSESMSQGWRLFLPAWLKGIFIDRSRNFFKESCKAFEAAMVALPA